MKEHVKSQAQDNMRRKVERNRDLSSMSNSARPIGICLTLSQHVKDRVRVQVDSMAPRLRSSARKVKRDAVLESGLPVNTRGLPTFPVELLLEILSHTSEATVPIPNKIAKPLPPKYLERTTALRTLSQLCRSLRSMALPALWEKIEAWATTSEYAPHTLHRCTGWHKNIATDLIAQLETVTIRAPSLASYVRYVICDVLYLPLQNFRRVVNVLITPHSTDTVLIELARCMALMKNLHTVQISSYSNAIHLPRCRDPVLISTLYKAAFAGYRFPSVRRIALNSGWETVLLPCFPEARWVYMAFFRKPSKWEAHWHDLVLVHVKKLASLCPKVQVFEWDAERYRPWAIADGKSHL